MRMRQETFKKSYYIPAFGKSIEIRRNQDIDEEGVLGKELLAQYCEDCILEGETKSLMEKVASGDIGGSSLTTEQTAAIEKIAGLNSSASEIDLSVNKKISFVFGYNMYNITSEKYFLDTTQYVPAVNGGNSPIFDNSSTFKRYGGKTMRIGESAAGDSTTFGKKTNLENPIDLSQTDLFNFWVYVDGNLVSNLSSASSYGAVMFIIGDLNLANSKGANILGVAGGSWHKGWNNITVLKSEFSINVSGSFSWNNAQTFQIRVDAGSNNIGTLFHFDSVFLGGKKLEKIPVCITLDDSTKNSYKMTKIMNQYGIVTSNFIIPDFIDNHSMYTDYMTLEMTKDLYDSGNHIGMHHQNVNGFALDKSLLSTTSNWLREKGFTKEDGHLYGSYPNGSYNQESIDYAKQIGIKGLRSLTGISRDDSLGREATTGLIHHESLFNGGIADLYRINSTKPTNVTDFTNKLNIAISKSAGLLTYHHLFNEFTNEAEWTSLAQYLKSKVDDGTIECLTFPQFCKKYS